MYLPLFPKRKDAEVTLDTIINVQRWRYEKFEDTIPKSYIEGQTIKWPTEKGQKDKQWPIKNLMSYALFLFPVKQSAVIY